VTDLAQLAAVAGRQESTPAREAMIAALNGGTPPTPINAAELQQRG